MNGKRWMLPMLCCGLLGCVSYQPKPLPAIQSNALAPPNKNIIAAAAALPQNPRLPPLRLDFSRPLTLQELAIIAVLVNPDLQTLRSKIGVANAQVFAAGLLPDPKLTGAYGWLLNPGPGLTNGYNIELDWDVFSLLTRQLKIKSATAQYQQTRYDVAWQEWLVANQTQILASRVYFTERQLAFAKKNNIAAQQLLAITMRNLQRHDAKIDEFALRQSSYLDLADQQQTLNRALTKNRLQLNQTLGLPPEEKLALAVKPITIPKNLNAISLFNQAQVNRLDLIALRAGYSSQELQLHQAVIEQFPAITLGVAQATDTTNVPTLGPVASLNLPIFNRNRGAIAIAAATREQLYREYHARLHQTRADIAALVADLQRIAEEQQLLKQALPQARETERLMRSGLNSGNVSLVSYEDVRANLFNKEIKLLTLEQDAAEQMINLQLAVGALQPFSDGA